MANAKKCDRCGKYYDKNSGNVSKINFVDDNYCGDLVLDLCDDCLYDLKRFMSGVELKEAD